MPIEGTVDGWVGYLWGWWVGFGFSGVCYITGLSCVAACLVFSQLELLGISYF